MSGILFFIFASCHPLSVYVTLNAITIAYSQMKKQNLVLINNATYQRETLSEQPIRQPF